MAKKYPYQVRFYYSERGVSEVRKFLRELPRKHRKKCLYYFNFVREHGTSVPKHIAEKIADNLYELKPEYDNNEYRFLFGIFNASRLVVVTALKKKSNRLPQRVFDLATERIQLMQAKEEVNDEVR